MFYSRKMEDFLQETAHFQRINRLLFSFHLPLRYFFQHTPQLTFACSKSTIETLKKGVKYVQS